MKSFLSVEVPAFKFTKRANADLMLCEHIFRLGTLYDFRSIEIHGANIGDTSEGTCSVTSEIITFNSDYDPQLLAHAQDFTCAWTRGHLTEKPQIKMLQMTIHNLLLYCASLTFDETNFMDFDSDVCIRIKDFLAFSKALVNSVNFPIEKTIIRPCEYIDKSTLTPKTPIPSLAFWKPPKYLSQKEIRLAIAIFTDPVEPLLIHSPEAAKFCEVFREKN
jgi:hypothetical protein